MGTAQPWVDDFSLARTLGFARTSLLLLAFVACAVAGCTHPDGGQVARGPQPQVLLQAYNPLTNERLGGADVVRWDWVAGQPCVPTPAGATASDGLYLSDVPALAPTFMFHKPGYRPAEVRVDGDAAFVSSPSPGNRWRSRNTLLFGLFPITDTAQPNYERTVRSRPLISVPMWPEGEK